MEKQKRGFGSPNYDKAKQREVASKGGKRAHELGTAHKWDSESARVAGRKGGLARGGKPRRRAPRVSDSPAWQSPEGAVE